MEDFGGRGGGINVKSLSRETQVNVYLPIAMPCFQAQLSFEREPIKYKKRKHVDEYAVLQVKCFSAN